MTARKMPVAVPVMRIPRWRALDPSGIAHAWLSRDANAPAVCGAKNQPERYDHPKGRRCPDCVKALEATS